MSIWQKPCKCHHTCEVTINNILFSVVFSFFPLKTVFPRSLFPASSSSLSSSTLFQIFFPVSFCLLSSACYLSFCFSLNPISCSYCLSLPFLSLPLLLTLALSLHPIYFSLPSGVLSASSFQSIKSIWILSSSSPSSLLLLSSSSVGDPELVCVCGVREMLLSVMLNQEWTLRGKLTHREIKLLYSLHLNHF